MAFKTTLQIPGVAINGYFIGEETDPSGNLNGATRTMIDAEQDSSGANKGFTTTGGLQGSGGLFAYGSTGISPNNLRNLYRDNFFSHWISDYGSMIYRIDPPEYKDHVVTGTPGYPNAEKIASYQSQPSNAVDFAPVGTTNDTTAGVTIGNTNFSAHSMPTHDGLLWTADNAFPGAHDRIVLIDYFGNVHVDRALTSVDARTNDVNLTSVVTNGDMTDGIWTMTHHGSSDGHGMLGLRFHNLTNNGGQTSGVQIYGIYNAVFINRDGHLVGVIPDPEYDVTSGVAPPTDYVGFGDNSGGGIQIGCGRIVIANPKWSDTSVNANAWTEGNTGNYRGKIYIYDLNFQLVAEVTEPTPGDVNYFGHKVRIGYDRIYVSAPGYHLSSGPENTSPGNVYMYDLNGNLIETFNFSAYTLGSAEGIGYSLELQDARVLIGCSNAKTNSNGALMVFNPDGEGQTVYFPSHSASPIGEGEGELLIGNGLFSYQYRLSLGTYSGQSLAWVSIRDTYGFKTPANIDGRYGGFLDYEKHLHADGLQQKQARVKSGGYFTPSAAILENVTVQDTDNTTAAPGIEFNQDGKIYGLGNQYSGGKYFLGYWNGGTTPRQEILGSTVVPTQLEVIAYNPSGAAPNGTNAHGAATLNLNQWYDLPNGDGSPSERRWYWQYSDSSSGISFIRFQVRQKNQNTVLRHDAAPDLMYYTIGWDNTGNTPTETISLSGTSGVPIDAFGLTAQTDLVIGWEFRADGTIYEVGGAYGTQQHGSWCSTNPSTTYYIRFTTNSGTSPTAAYSDTLNTWHALSSTRDAKWYCNPNTFVSGSVKVEIASDSGGSNILATGYYGIEVESGQ